MLPPLTQGSAYDIIFMMLHEAFHGTLYFFGGDRMETDATIASNELVPEEFDNLTDFFHQMFFSKKRRAREAQIEAEKVKEMKTITID